MEKHLQKQIADDIIKAFSTEFMKVVENIPEEWDGFEIRQLAVDWMNENYTVQHKHEFGNKRSKRRKDYESFKLNNRMV